MWSLCGGIEAPPRVDLFACAAAMSVIAPKFLLLVSIALNCLWACRCDAQDASEREYQIKAAFIYNFVQFVKWPDDAFADGQAPLVLGVLGDPDPFDGALEQIVKEKSIEGHRIQVRHFPTADAV